MNCPKCHFENPADSSYCAKCGIQLDTPGPMGTSGPASNKISASHTKTLHTPMKELTRGSTFAGRYQVIEELGRGGMERVYKVFEIDKTKRDL